MTEGKEQIFSSVNAGYPFLAQAGHEFAPAQLGPMMPDDDGFFRPGIDIDGDLGEVLAHRIRIVAEIGYQHADGGVLQGEFAPAWEPRVRALA